MTDTNTAARQAWVAAGCPELSPLDAVRYALAWAWWKYIAWAGGPRHHSYGYAVWRAYCCRTALRGYLRGAVR